MKILSLFDGLSCGMIAMKNAGVQVDRYVAYKIDKYAIKVSTHNFPEIEQKGDVFTADFTEYEGFDWLIGGSPCTYWSIAQKNNRETEASGLGWELFSQYVRALHEAKPKYFIYENNKSMAKAIRDSIRETFGFEEICINSALVSAQNRQRYYWVGKRNEDGTYSKVDVQQPEDRGILLKDVLDGAEVYRSAKGGKGFCLDASYWKTPGSPETFLEGNHARANRNMAAEPIRIGKVGNGGQGNRIYSIDGKSVTQQAQSGGLGSNTGAYAVPVPRCVAQRGRYASGNRSVKVEGGTEQFYEARPDGKTSTLTTVQKDNMVAEPVEEVNPRVISKMDDAVSKFGYIPEMWNPYNNAEITDKSPTASTMLSRQNASCSLMCTLGIPQYATPCEWDEHGIPTKAISGADGKTYTVYSVQNGQITIKGKTYPIKLIDGYYIIRKLTVSECKRLQTVPEWFDFGVISNSQAYKCLGNGWTCDVITHLINACLR